MMANKPVSVLVTDDQSNIRLMVRAALESEGYDVSEACDGRAALDAVSRDRPDLMILDLNMPVLDGIAVLEQMKGLAAERRPEVIVLTAYGSIPAAVRATRLGAADFLEKPVTPDVLRRSVRGVLDEPGERPAPGRAEPPGGYEAVLARVRKALRLMELTDAEALLMRAAERRDQQSAAYFNLLGILYESQHHWRLARKCYGKALDANEHYEPAKTNFRRLDEMRRDGHTERRVVLGDEPDDVWFAQMPVSHHE
jgi:DNA-binding response OmpR family regulator